MQDIKLSWSAPIPRSELRPMMMGAAVGLLSSSVIIGLFLALVLGTP